MVRRIILLGIFFITFNSCVKINEYGYARFRFTRSKLNTIPNDTSKVVYNIIDTNSIYKLIKIEYIKASGMQKCEYYKFYSNGKIGEFHCFEQDFTKSLVLEPKKGYMGFYYFEKDHKKIIVKFLYSNWHGNRIQTDTIEIKKDSLIKIHNGKEKSKIISIYVKEPIPENVKIIPPDW